MTLQSMTTTVKTLAAASVLAVATTTASFAGSAGYNYIIPGEQMELKTELSLNMVRASENGTVSVYDFTHGEKGALLGSTEVHAGANQDVKIMLNANAAQDAIIVLTTEDGTVPLATTTLKHL